MFIWGIAMHEGMGNGSPAVGSTGEALVEGLRDEVLQKMKHCSFLTLFIHILTAKWSKFENFAQLTS